MPAGKTTVRHAGLSWDGAVAYALTESHGRVEADGKVSIQGLDVAAAEQRVKQKRLAWKGRRERISAKLAPTSVKAKNSTRDQ